MYAPNTRFLVVDDFKTMRAIVKRTLQQMGYSNIDEAEDGVKALEMLNKAKSEPQPYDFVVSDWNMPNMSGLELLKNVRSDATLKALPFVLVTAENEQTQVIEAAKAGVSNYIVKPFTRQDFEAKLKTVYLKFNKVAA